MRRVEGQNLHDLLNKTHQQAVKHTVSAQRFLLTGIDRAPPAGRTGPCRSERGPVRPPQSSCRPAAAEPPG